MKKLLILLFPGLAIAAPTIENKEVVCDDTEKIFSLLTNQKYKEAPGWLGVSSRSKFVLFVNHDKNTWSLVEYDKNDACVIGAGRHSEFVTIEPKYSPSTNLR